MSTGTLVWVVAGMTVGVVFFVARGTMSWRHGLGAWAVMAATALAVTWVRAH